MELIANQKEIQRLLMAVKEKEEVRSTLNLLFITESSTNLQH